MRGRKVPVKWTTIRVPAEVRDAIKFTAKRMHFPMWQIVYQAVSYYRTAYLSHFEKNATDIGKVAWYIYKISASIGSFREKPTKENGELLQKTAMQLAERMDINIDLLKTAAVKYYHQQTEENRILLNDAGKDIVAQLLAKLDIIEKKSQQ
ncbi:hypothetical protein [Candidatus Methanodesulfokora washburnensis]|uniref:Uncharacterized protein n=1 Tax=Candidatus Methanodesulfokora washburnensis TaxID=2478471 RepID=A0A3R9PF40_9CREN|nr:hypothetical protein [Candidatus Methanodesulfokores washburnensis]RSN72703.1 hypothetical protein D6D85_12740 [Candidatus Methanodesulfokores washburnensis]